MQGLGNDFIVINNLSGDIMLSQEQIQSLSDRHFGVWCDQLLLVEHSQIPEMDFKYRIFNSDGGEVEQCGNGARCFARYVSAKNITDKKVISVETMKTTIILHICDDNQIEVDMDAPIFEGDRIPLQGFPLQTKYMIEGEELGVLSMGNPHAVRVCSDLMHMKIEDIAQKIQKSVCFPEGVNVGFMEVVGSSEIQLRVYERGGTWETLACGTGACAAVVYGIEQGLLGEGEVQVNLPGGRVYIQYYKWGKVMMKGSAEFVFEGVVEL